MVQNVHMPIYRVVNKLTYNGPGSPGVNVMHVRTVSGPGSELDAAMAAMHQFYASNELQLASGLDVTIGESIIEDPLGARTVVPFTPTTVEGYLTSAVAPQLLAICCSWKTSSATRRGRGRTFLGPVAAGAIDPDGSISDSARTSALEAAQDFVSASTAASGWSFGILSSVDSLLRDVINVTISDQFAYLSSRRD